MVQLILESENGIYSIYKENNTEHKIFSHESFFQLYDFLWEYIGQKKYNKISFEIRCILPDVSRKSLEALINSKS